MVVIALLSLAWAQEPVMEDDWIWLYDKLPKPGTMAWEYERASVLSKRRENPNEARRHWVWLVQHADDRYAIWKKNKVGGVDRYQDVDGDSTYDWADLCPGLQEDGLVEPYDGCPDDGRKEQYLPGDSKLYARGDIWSYGSEETPPAEEEGDLPGELYEEALAAWEVADYETARRKLDELKGLGIDTADARALRDKVTLALIQEPLPEPEPAPVPFDWMGHLFPGADAPASAPAPAPAPAPVAAKPQLRSIDTPLRSGQRHAADTAVVVGIADYLRLPDVPYADRDADAFQGWLTYTRGVPLDRIHVPPTGSKEHIEAAVERAGKEVGPGGTVWVYFAGHGAADPVSSERILLGDDVSADTTSFSSRGVSVARLEALAAAGGGQPVLMLDACFTGVGRGGSDLVAGKRFMVPAYAQTTRKQAVQWNAAGPNEAAGPLEEVQHGAFTYLLVGALRGWADGELSGQRDGKVTGEEAQAYVTRALKALQLRDQRPVWLGPSSTVLSEGVSEPGPTLQ